MMRPRTPILATLTAVLAVGAPAWPLASGLFREAREVQQQVQDGQRLVIDTPTRVSPMCPLTRPPRHRRTPTPPAR